MATLTQQPKLAIVPVMILCILSFITLVSYVKAEDVAVDIPGDTGNGLADDLTDFFQTLVRNRRQLPRRADEDKEGFTEEERQALLTIHNAHRSTVNPRAANMIEVRWNSLIEEFAQNWTNGCKPMHRPNRNLGTWINMGENIFWQGGGTYLEKTAVDFWWNEYRSYNFSTKACDSVCGHYITAAWAKTEFIGCGIKRCDTLPPITNSKVYLFVCDYSGRFLSNARPYEEGTPCSNCPVMYPRCRYNLCVTQDKLDNCQGYNGTSVYISADRENSVTDPMNCPGFAVDPVNTTPEPVPTGNQNTDSVDPNTTDSPGDNLATSIVSSSLSLMLCLSLYSLFFTL